MTRRDGRGMRFGIGGREWGKKLTEQDQNTLQYYDQNAAKFVVNTKRVEFHFVQDK